jgi:hypothetical protein
MSFFTVKSLIECATTVSTQIKGQYVPARPMPWPWAWRIRPAWEVLRGRADAVKWPEGQ